MTDEINLPLILLAALMATASPGPATLAIAGTSMTSGRAHGLALAAGVTSGSWIWSLAAALGLGAVMLANAWAFEVMRYFGAGYLLYLAFRSARSALRPSAAATKAVVVTSRSKAYARGLALHLTNPKAILFFGSLYAIGIPPGAPLSSLVVVIAAIGLQSLILFHAYALLFSSAPMVAGYAKLRRWFEALFAVAFGLAGLKILTARLD
jgi:threonine/homoserine/homoserine lactone efflux protein